MIREACALAFEKRIKVLAQIADGAIRHEQKMPDGTKHPFLEKAEMGDRLKAMDLLGKYGGLQRQDLTSDDKPLAPTGLPPGRMTPEEVEAEVKRILHGELGE